LGKTTAAIGLAGPERRRVGRNRHSCNQIDVTVI
jgi:hypothetical protein